MKQTSSAVVALMLMGSAEAVLSSNLKIQNAGLALWTPQKDAPGGTAAALTTTNIDTPTANEATWANIKGPSFEFKTASATSYATSGRIANPGTKTVEAFKIVETGGPVYTATLKNPGCVSCIMLGGAWCSGVWAFSSKGEYANPVTGGSKVDDATNNDLGQCCWKPDKDAQGAVQNLNAAGLGGIKSTVWSKNLCPAMWPATAYAAGDTTDVGEGNIAKAFWCSNGWT